METDIPLASLTTRERELVDDARVGRLATVRPDGHPHVVPVTFASIRPGVLVTAVDHKPKSTTDLQRIRNIEANPAVALLVDHYDDDWATLWWVRLDATARIVVDEPQRTDLAAALEGKYRQYVGNRPAGPVIAMTVHRVASWNLDRQN